MNINRINIISNSNYILLVIIVIFINYSLTYNTDIHHLKRHHRHIPKDLLNQYHNNLNNHHNNNHHSNNNNNHNNNHNSNNIENDDLSSLIKTLELNENNNNNNNNNKLSYDEELLVNLENERKRENIRIKEFEERESERIEVDKKITIPSSTCKNCEQHKLKISETELTELRIEFVKNQILKKLRLTERPKVTVSDLPIPIADGETLNSMLNVKDNNNRVFDDYYAQTTQKIIFPKDDINECKHLLNAEPTNCFTFELKNNVEDVEVNVAELWFYKHPDIMDEFKQTFVISEVVNWKSNRNMIKTNPIAIQATDVKAGWVKINILYAVKNWYKYTDFNHILHIACSTCGDNSTMLLSQEQKYKPFIVIDTNTIKHPRRPKRNVNCSGGVTECCREKLYISFAEIGWDDWILHPPGYDAYFCRGSCSSAATVTMSGSHYNSVLRKVIFQRRTVGAKSLELVPCCTATRFSSLQLFYMDSDNTAVQKTLPNMVVEDCGCN